MSGTELQKPKKNNRKLAVFCLALMILIMLGAAAYIITQTKSVKKSLPVTKTLSSTQPNSSAQTKPPSDEHFGYIEGTPTFPGGSIPADEQVCAENADTHKPACVKVVQIPKGPYIYSMGLPAGNYYIYATAAAETHKYRAYFNVYVLCGAKPTCAASGHKNYVKVAVTDGSKGYDLNPTDWDDPSQTK
ncbi:MAG: hypothetical protein NVS1B7_2560 [Candidatus Saccharimonadales bacterium]